MPVWVPQAHMAAASQHEDAGSAGEPEHRFQQAAAGWSRYCPVERSADVMRGKLCFVARGLRSQIGFEI